MKVFICDDNEDILELLEMLVQELGIDVESCEEGEGAISIIEEVQPNLIILDYWLKGMKADDLIRQIKESETIKSTPIILISATTNLETIAKALEVEDFVKKPFDIFEFQDKIKKYCITPNTYA